ncbi:hypothetical protein CK203_112094 [Vitis vinifera]|uniref:Uncharacterized protein n=1 Tax=Vitis vinifera TaxID=29760 RepID=A0A438FDS5_VITVI|nr:hypothetical protein CK203_112094 [Vitis vinifera]
MPPEHDMPGPSEPTDPSQEAPPAEQTVPHEETTIVEIETPIQSTQTTIVEPSSPHDPPPMTQTPCHLGSTTSSLYFNRSCHIEDNVQLGWGKES